MDKLLRWLVQYLMETHALSCRKIPSAEACLRTAVAQQGDCVARAKALVEMMSTEEKIACLAGKDNFAFRGVARLGIPVVWMADATSGVRGVDAPVTTFPAAVSLACTWNGDLVRRVAHAIGCECRAVGVSILLAPGVNLARVPVNGRNFEYFGEDPYLSGNLASAYAEGARKAGVVCTVKHLVCNNSEYDRHKSDSQVSRQALRELYLPAFKAAVDAGVLGIMSSYNQVNGVYASEQREVLEEIVRKEWGFSGMIVSDWNSLYSTGSVLQSGVDLEMPGPKWLSPQRVSAALKTGGASIADIDKKLVRILSALDAVGALDRPIVDTKAPIGTASHRAIALDAACEAIVLLQNKGSFLPLDRELVKSVVVMGRNADPVPSGGGGSSHVTQGLPVQALDAALRDRLGKSTKIKTLGNGWWRSSAKRKLVSEADAVVFATGFDSIWESEAYDRPWDLPPGEERCLLEACNASDKVVVVVHAGSGFSMDRWIDGPKSVLFAGYLGQFSSQAIVKILFGQSVPSGKLPFSLGRNSSDYLSMRTYPRNYAKISMKRLFVGQGEPEKRSILPLPYDEGLLVGYRQFDTVGPDPLFPFGHGLSYASFSYEDPSCVWKVDDGVRHLSVVCTVRNIGGRSAAEVLQVYVSRCERPAGRPVQELKAFKKVSVGPHDHVAVECRLGMDAFSWFDEASGCWGCPGGLWKIRIGSSSRDIRCELPVEIPLEAVRLEHALSSDS